MNKKINKFSKYLNLVFENLEISENIIFQNNSFIKEMSDVSLICIGFRNKKLSDLEQGSLIAGETEYLNRFKNFKKFLGNTKIAFNPKDKDMFIEPSKGVKSVSGFIKRRANEIQKELRITKNILKNYKDKKEELSAIDQNTKKELENKIIFLSNKIKILTEALKDVDELIGFLNLIFAKMKKIRKNKSILKNIFSKKTVEKQKKERLAIRNMAFDKIEIILKKLKENIKYINFDKFVPDMAKLRIIESSMGH